MDPKNKLNVENQKKMAQKKLEAQRAFLKEKGATAEEIKKNVTIRKLNAEVRQADYRLATIAAQEKKAQDLAQAKAEKLAAAKVPKEKKKKEVKVEAPAKKGKGEKKAAPGAAKKEKK
jgi:hypothetical protein